MIDTTQQDSKLSSAGRSLLLHVPTLPTSITTSSNAASRLWGLVERNQYGPCKKYPSSPGYAVAIVYISPGLLPRRV
jgi:hypothetical protein